MQCSLFIKEKESGEAREQLKQGEWLMPANISVDI